MSCRVKRPRHTLTQGTVLPGSHDIPHVAGFGHRHSHRISLQSAILLTWSILLWLICQLSLRSSLAGVLGGDDVCPRGRVAMSGDILGGDDWGGATGI